MVPKMWRSFCYKELFYLVPYLVIFSDGDGRGGLGWRMKLHVGRGEIVGRVQKWGVEAEDAKWGARLGFRRSTQQPAEINWCSLVRVGLRHLGERNRWS